MAGKQNGSVPGKRKIMKLDQEIMYKAETLIEALPYIQRFNRKIIVVKYGEAPWLMKI